MDSSLQKVVLPEGLELIESDAFRKCTGLYSINYPSTLKEIKDGAFVDCGLPILEPQRKDMKFNKEAYFATSDKLTKVNPLIFLFLIPIVFIIALIIVLHYS